MAGFTVRIELHNASGADYEKLHTAMEGAGFSRTIKGSDGVLYHLPTAEYRYASLSEDVGTVRTKANNVAKLVKTDPGVFVTQGDIAAWVGLDKV